MELKNTKFIKTGLGMTRMEWVCTEMQETSIHGKKDTRYIGCVDYTLPSRLRPVFFIHKGQPPEPFDFQEHAPRSSYEQLAFAQIITMNWDKLNTGDTLRFDNEMEEKIRGWHGRIWSGGSSITSKKINNENMVLERQKIPLHERVLPDRHVHYTIKNTG